jgi:hypothetical protein
MPRFWDDIPHEKCELTGDCHESGFGIFLFRRPSSPSGISLAMEASRQAMAEERERRPGRLATAWAKLKRRFAADGCGTTVIPS